MKKIIFLLIVTAAGPAWAQTSNTHCTSNGWAVDCSTNTQDPNSWGFQAGYNAQVKRNAEQALLQQQIEQQRLRNQQLAQQPLVQQQNLDIERQRLELERQRLDLERQKLELERLRLSQQVVTPQVAVPQATAPQSAMPTTSQPGASTEPQISKAQRDECVKVLLTSRRDDQAVKQFDTCMRR